MFDVRPLPIEYDHVQDTDLDILISEVNVRVGEGWRIQGSLVIEELGPKPNFIFVLYRENQVLGGAAGVPS